MGLVGTLDADREDGDGLWEVMRWRWCLIKNVNFGRNRVGKIVCTDGSKGAAKPTLLVENARTRVTEWRFARPGDNTGWHRHEYDYIVVPIQDGILEISDTNGNISKHQLRTGVPYFRNAGVEHDVFNGSEGEFAFIEVELLETAQSQT